MIPDHIHPNRAAPETYDRDWFLAQLNGRDPTAPDAFAAPAQPPAEHVVEAVGPPATEVLEQPPVPAAARPGITVGSRVRYAGALAGAGVGVLLVASAAFALGGMPTPVADPPAQAQPDGAPTPSRTPKPQLTTLALPGEAAPPTSDTVRGRADSPRSDPPPPGQAPDSGDSSDPSSSPTPSGSSAPTTPPTPTPEPSTDDPSTGAPSTPAPSPSPSPSETEPSDPDPTPDPDPTSAGLCDVLPDLC